MHRTIFIPILALSLVGWAFIAPAPVHAAPIPSGTVFTTYADNSAGNGPGTIMMLQKDKDPVQFGFLDPGADGPWVAPLGFGPDGHLYLGSKANKGTLYDITAGGDRSSDKPLATGFWSVLPHKMGGMAFDAEGNVYLSMGQTQDEDSGTSDPNLTQPIVRVNLKTGAKSNINGLFNHAWGLAIRPNADKSETLYIVEQGLGRVVTYNLTTDKLDATPIATGFGKFTDHAGGMLAFDQRGKLFVGWQIDPDVNTYGMGIYDITPGSTPKGDFSDITKTPPVVMYPNRSDVNGMVFDSKNNLIIGGDNTFWVWFSPFDANTGKFGDFVHYTSTDSGGGDNETVAIVP